MHLIAKGWIFRVLICANAHVCLPIFFSLIEQQPKIQRAMEDAGQKILNPLLSLDTPGKATVQVVILADPVRTYFPLLSFFSALVINILNGLYVYVCMCRYAYR